MHLRQSGAAAQQHDYRAGPGAGGHPGAAARVALADRFAKLVNGALRRGVRPMRRLRPSCKTRLSAELLARRQPGQVVVVAALGMLALIAALALVVDIGLLWESQRELQKTADSAALAGVVLLPDDAAGAIDRAQTYASVNLGIAAAFCAEPPTTT